MFEQYRCTCSEFWWCLNSVGKSAKYMYKWVSAQEWEKYLQTYCGADTEASNAMYFLQSVRGLSKDASEIL